ncbi:nitroreductase family protein [Streptomyces sp. NPDC048172]|uniref:nitroreductase family protein n=1 Tax=Streptomyces sp. NPDC048172 TaxID=3365505 RepID=UPI00371E8C7B
MATSGDAVALDYAKRIFERQRVPLPPLGFQVDWADQPARHKLYTDTVKLPLPSPFEGLPRLTLDAVGQAAAKPRGDRPPSLETLASALACYGLADRRTAPNWNEDSARKLRADQALWSRPTASGGGMYPVESYLVAGRGAPLPPGVYHYDTAHHSLDRLSLADRTGDLTQATGVGAGLYLVAAVRFWKNSFKYNSFCYHVVTQDCGALLASWRAVFAAAGPVIEPVMWFADAPVADALGLDGRTEAPFVVVPLGPPVSPDDGVPVPSPPTRAYRGGTPGERYPHWERSRRTRRFELVERVHAAALRGDEPRPPARAADRGDMSAAPEPDGRTVTLPAPLPRDGDHDLVGSLLRRRSSFGQFAARPPLAAGDLGWVLSAVDDGGRAGTDVAPAPQRSAWTRLWVLANSVEGLERRAYAYRRDGQHHLLTGGAEVDFGELQRSYALANYNMREVAAVMVITGRLPALVDAYGARGYRMLGVEVGHAAQLAYLAATARGLGVGAVLGLDNLTVDGLLGIDGTDEHSMLYVLLGHDRPGTPGYDHALWRPRHPESHARHARHERHERPGRPGGIL